MSSGREDSLYEVMQGMKYHQNRFNEKRSCISTRNYQMGNDSLCYFGIVIPLCVYLFSGLEINS
jgi:hypothetical protein